MFINFLLSILFVSFSIAQSHALYFDGINDYVTLAPSNILSNVNSYAIEIDISKVDVNNPQNTCIIQSGWYGSGRFASYFTSNHKFRFTHWIDGGNPTTSSQIPNDERHTLSLSYDKTSNIGKVYIDGVEEGLASMGDDFHVFSDPFYIGGSPGMETEWLDGYIFEVRIWNLDLNPSAIGSYLNQDLSGDEDGLIGLWKMNEGTGETLIDYSGNQNNGTIHGATWVEDVYGCTDSYACNYDSDSIVADDGSCDYSCHVNPSIDGLNFDGIDDFVEALHSESLSITDQLSIIVWTEPDFSEMDENGGFIHSYAIITKGWDPCENGSTVSQYHMGFSRESGSDLDLYMLRPHFLVQECDWVLHDGNNTIEAGDDVMLTMIYNLGHRKSYINDTYDGSVGSASGSHLVEESGTLRFSSYSGSDGSTMYPYRGIIKQAVIIPSVLDEADVSAIYNSNGENLEEYTPVAWYKFAKGTGDILYDHSGNQNHATIYGASWLAASCNDDDVDCNGECFGDAVFDECDQCSGGNSSHEYNSDIDECGVCFGNNYSDECLGSDECSVMDCNGDCGGDAVLSGCNNTCNSILEDDCAGECDGDAEIDSFNNCCLDPDTIDACGYCEGNGWDYCNEDEDPDLNYDDWGYGAHSIEVTDVPDDQGGRVHISFSKSFYDTDSLRTLEAYTIERNDGDYWTAMLTVSAYGSNIYHGEVETLINNLDTEFRVIASMEEGNFVSLDDENGIGVSEDNIDPSVPEDIFASSQENNINISWDYIHDIDFDYHMLTDISNNESYTIENQISVLENSQYNEYHVNSVDSNGNSSDDSEYISAHLLHIEANLVSFGVLPDDNSIGNLIPCSADSDIEAVIGAGFASTCNPIIGWIGTVTHIYPDQGYWIKSDNGMTLIIIGENEVDPQWIFNLNEGANLISYACDIPEQLDVLIPVSDNLNITGVIGEGVAASPNPVLGWVGSLEYLEPGKGYWFKVNSDTELIINCPSE